jgi:protein tyrosine/serine phosphatase
MGLIILVTHPSSSKQRKHKNFYKIMDNSDNYPVLIHCYHGTGRAEMYSALYRIEYEKFTNEAARQG